MIRIGLCKFGFLRMTLVACIGIPLIIASNAFAQNLQPLSTDIGAAPTPPASTEVERVIVTGSNIPTAEEVGPNPVDIYNRELTTCLQRLVRLFAGFLLFKWSCREKQVNVL